jgi:hypothetical protein
MLFTLHEYRPLWQVIKAKLGLPDNLDDLNEFGTYCASYSENTSNYWMGLEIVLWLWRERKPGGCLGQY